MRKNMCMQIVTVCVVWLTAVALAGCIRSKSSAERERCQSNPSNPWKMEALNSIEQYSNFLLQYEHRLVVAVMRACVCMCVYVCVRL